MARVLSMLTQTLESLQNEDFDLFLLHKEYNFCLKKYRGLILHDTEEWCKIWRKLTCSLENDKRNLVIFTRALKSLKIGTLMGFFYPKWKMYELKIYRGVMCHDIFELKIGTGVIFHDTEEWCKIWRKTGLWFGKWQQ